MTAATPRSVTIKDDPSQAIFRLRGALRTLVAITASTGGYKGQPMDINSEDFCGMIDLMLAELDRIAECVS